MIFRPTTRHWLTEFILPVLIILAPALLLFFYGLDRPRLNYLLAALVIVSLLMVKRIALPMWRSRIEIDPEQISGQINKATFKFFWAEVQAAWKTTSDLRPAINLATHKQEGSIPVKLFDQKNLWQQIQQHALPSALEDRAYKKLPQYLDYAQANAKLISETIKPLRVSMTFIKVVGWGCAILFLGATIASFLAGERGVSLVFLAFSLLGVYFIIGSGIVEMDAEAITVITLLGRYHIRWDEVSSVETDAQRQGIVFVGDNKRLAMPGPAYWSGDEKLAMIKLYLAQIEQRNLEVKETQKALWRVSKKVKVR